MTDDDRAIATLAKSIIEAIPLVVKQQFKDMNIGINDSIVSTKSTWSSNKINNDISALDSKTTNSLISKANITYVDQTVSVISSNVAMMVTPEAYGAKGDGVTDDTIAVQKAINMASGYNDVNLASGLTSVTGYLTSNGSISASATWITYARVGIDKSSTYVLSNLATSSSVYVVLYDINLNVTRSILQSTLISLNGIVNTTSSEVFIRFSSYNTSPSLIKTITEGKMLYLNRKKYRVTDRLYIHKALMVMGASRDESIIFFDGADWTGTEIEDDPINYPESHGAINIKADGCVLQNFTIKHDVITSAQASNWHGITMHYIVGASIQQVYIRGFKSGVFSFGGWNKYFLGCNFVDNKVAGIQYKALKIQEVGNWSGSGDIIQSSQFIGNDVGLLMDRVFETTAQNCIFEYNRRAIQTYGCLDVLFISCWNEANTDKILIDGNAKFIGGYNITQNTIEHISTGDGIVFIEKTNETFGIKGTEIVFSQIGGIITKGVSIGSALINMFENPTFGTIAQEVLYPWSVDTTNLISIDSVNTLNDANSMLINCMGQSWDSDPNYGFNSEKITVTADTDYVFSGYIKTDDFTAIDKQAQIQVWYYDANGNYAGNLVTGTNITPIASNTWEKFSVSFNTGNINTFVAVKIYLVHYGKVWISNPMISVATVTADNITLKKTDDPNIFNVVDYLGVTTKQLVSKEYVDTAIANALI